MDNNPIPIKRTFKQQWMDEDQIDLKDARSALKDIEKNGTISWENLKAELGL